MIAVALARGKFTIAASNNIVPPTSPTTRNTTAFIISVRSGRSASANIRGKGQISFQSDYFAIDVIDDRSYSMNTTGRLEP